MAKRDVIKAYALKNAVEHDGKAQIGSIINGLFNERLKKENIKKLIPEIQEKIDEINKLDFSIQKIEYEKLKKFVGQRKAREGLPELEKVGKRGVIMRFSPSPSGPLHIGHALTASPSFLYYKRYGGKFYVRIEDTNPENIYKPSYEMIEKESKWLFGDETKFVIQSYRMNLYYKYIEKLLRKKSIYVCTCSQDKFKLYISNKKSCPCRNLLIKDQMMRWKKMLDKKGYKEGEAVIRFKSGMYHKNPAFRDFPLARINTTKHPLQNNKYKVWPLMNLAVIVDDIDMKMTHIIRAKDHRDNAEKQKLVFKALGKKYPVAYFLGRIHIKGMELSSSKMQIDIKNGKYKGWDDPNLLTIQSLKNKGYKPIAIHKLAEQIGLNEVDKIIDRKELFLLLNNFNKQKNL